MLKRIIGIDAQDDLLPLQEAHWLDLGAIAEVEVTSELPEHPIEHALLPPASSGWRAGTPGLQTIRLLFNAPQNIERIQLHFFEEDVPREQEYVLRYASVKDPSMRDVLRQQWNFSPMGSHSEKESHRVHLTGVTVLELAIEPDRSTMTAHASLRSLRVC